MPVAFAEDLLLSLEAKFDSYSPAETSSDRTNSAQGRLQDEYLRELLKPSFSMTDSKSEPVSPKLSDNEEKKSSPVLLDFKPGSAQQSHPQKARVEPPEREYQSKLENLVRGQEEKAKEHGGFHGWGLRAIRQNLERQGLPPLNGNQNFGHNPKGAVRSFSRDPRFEVSKEPIDEQKLKPGDIILDTGRRQQALMYLGNGKIASDGQGNLSDRKFSDSTYIVRLRPDYKKAADSEPKISPRSNRGDNRERNDHKEHEQRKDHKEDKEQKETRGHKDKETEKENNKSESIENGRRPQNDSPYVVPSRMDKAADYTRQNLHALSRLSSVERNITLAAEAMRGKQACEYAGWENNALREAGGTCAGSVSGVLRLAYPGIDVHAGAWELGRRLEQNYGFKEDAKFRDNPAREVRIAVSRGHIGMICPAPTRAEKTLSMAEKLESRTVDNNGSLEKRLVTSVARDTTFEKLACDQFKSCGIKASRQEINERAMQLAELNGAARAADKVKRGSTVSVFSGQELKELRDKVASGFRDPKDKWDGLHWYDNHGAPGGWGGRPPHSMSGYKFLKPSELPASATIAPSGKGRNHLPYNLADAREVQQSYTTMQNALAKLPEQSSLAKLTDQKPLLLPILSKIDSISKAGSILSTFDTPNSFDKVADTSEPRKGQLDHIGTPDDKPIVHDRNIEEINKKIPFNFSELQSRTNLASQDKDLLKAFELFKQRQANGEVPSMKQLRELAKSAAKDPNKQPFYMIHVPLATWNNGTDAIGVNLTWERNAAPDAPPIVHNWRQGGGNQLGEGTLYHNIEGENGAGPDKGWINQLRNERAALGGGGGRVDMHGRNMGNGTSAGCQAHPSDRTYRNWSNFQALMRHGVYDTLKLSDNRAALATYRLGNRYAVDVRQLK